MTDELIAAIERWRTTTADEGFYTRAGIDMACSVINAIIRRFYEGRPAVECKPLELQTRDELLAHLRRLAPSPSVVENIARYLAGDAADNTNGDWCGWHPYIGRANDIAAIAAMDEPRGRLSADEQIGNAGSNPASSAMPALANRLKMASGSANSFIRTGDGDEVVVPLDIAIAALGDALATGGRGAVKTSGVCAPSPAKHPIHCDFCGLSDEEVKRMAVTRGSAICNDCVEIAQQIFDHAEKSDAPASKD